MPQTPVDGRRDPLHRARCRRGRLRGNGARLRTAFEARPGHVSSRSAQALEDPARWVLVSEWTGVGAWRRALSAYDVRMEVIPLMALAENEPAVYEIPDRFTDE